jgi:NAD(P)-dependent dehydrogenase (short-subunit alcohol dehydrogenase family)
MGMLDGRVAIVTGGGRGIGRSHCLELAAHGATVVVNDLGVGVHGERDATGSPAEQVVEEIKTAGGTAVADPTSVTDWAGTAALVEETVGRFGRLDILVNNAGVVRDRMLTALSEEDLDTVLAVHVKGSVALTAHACRYWRGVVKSGGTVSGRVINTTSGTGLRGNVGQVPYGAAKAAVANLTLIAAMEVARYGVTVNAISPVAYTRMIATIPAMAGYQPDARWDRLDPGNSSPLVAWLASVESGWLTGQVLRIDGGTVWRMQPWTSTGSGYRARSGERLDPAELGAGLSRLYGVLPDGLAGLVTGEE